VLVRTKKQSPDIASGVHVGKLDLDVDAGDQGIMLGYASDETTDGMPLTHLIATRLGKQLTDVRKDGSLWWLSPDGKTQITIEYGGGGRLGCSIHGAAFLAQHSSQQHASQQHSWRRTSWSIVY